MKPFIVVADGFDKKLFNELSSVDALEVHPKPKVTEEELTALLPKVNGLVVRSATQVNASLLEKATSLKYVIRAGEGTDNIDLSLCQQKGIKVANTPGANSNSAAELAVALMMTVLRKTAWAHQSMGKGEWEKTAFSGNELFQKTVGIVGFGRIGQIVAKRLQGFDPKVLFFDPMVQNSDISYAKKVENLEELTKKADIISIHIPYLPSTHHLYGKDMLELMQPHAIIINASRGNIVDENALFNILSQNKIRGAGFDVFAKEPLDKESKLRSLSNIVLTPHIGASTDEAQYRVGEMVVHQVKEFFLYKKLHFEVKTNA